MVRAIVHKEDGRTLFVVSETNPELGALEDGQEVQLAITPNEPEEMSDKDFDAMIDRLIEKNRDALEYLAQ